MKILLITDLYPVKNDEKNTPRTLLNFVNEWQKLGHQVKIIKPNFILNSFIRKKPFYKTGWYEDIFNVNYWLPFMGNVKNKLKKFYEKDFQPDIVIAHMPSGILLADKLNLPFTAGVHCSDITVLTKPLYRYYFKPRLLKALNNARKIACRSFVLKEKLAKLYPDFLQKTFVAPSGIDEKYIVETPNLIDTKHLKVVTCAQLIKRKNIDKIIKGLKNIKPENLTIIGDGKEKNYLEKLAKEVNYPVIFLGRLPHEEVFEVMKNSDIFVLPSENETFGMVYLEAMASGCITIGVERDGIDGIIKHGYNGFTLIKPEAIYIEAIFTVIKNLENETLNKIQNNSITTAVEYTQKHCSQMYLREIVNNLK